jgi:predicted cupin superfamily sugar epimerase
MIEIVSCFVTPGCSYSLFELSNEDDNIELLVSGGHKVHDPSPYLH